MADSKAGDPHLDQDAVNKYWPPEKGSREIPGTASQIIGDAAMVAVGDSPIRDASAKTHDARRLIILSRISLRQQRKKLRSFVRPAMIQWCIMKQSN
jgi:hypothetical protein